MEDENRVPRHTQPSWGANDQAQRREGPAAVSDAGALSAARARVRARAWAHGRWPALWDQRPHDSAVATTLAARWPRGAGTFVSPAPAPARDAGGYRADPPGPPGARLPGLAPPAAAPAAARDPARHWHDSTDPPVHRAA